MSTGMNLGGASFQVTANTQPFVRGMAQVKAQAQQTATAVQAGMDNINRSSRGAAMGVLALSQAIDDAQYGFRAIVNNIPQVTYMMGGGAGLAGALGIAAVAINITINHWDKLLSTFGRTAPFEAVIGLIEQIKQGWKSATTATEEHTEKLSVLGQAVQNTLLKFGISGLVKQWNNATKAAEEHAKQVEKVKDATEKVSGIKGEMAGERGKDFEKALEQAGGGDAVAKKMLDEAIGKGGIKTKEAREAMADNIRVTLLKGIQGELVDKALPENARNKLDQLREQSEANRIAAGQRHGFSLMEGPVAEFKARQQEQAGWEAEGLRYRREFEEGRERKEKATAQDYSQSPLALAMLQGRKITSKDVEGLMKQSGIDTQKGGQRPAEVLKDLRKSMKEDIEKTMRETGATRAEATRMHEIELQQRARPQQAQQSEMMGITEFWKSTQTGALDTNKIAQQQLLELQKIKQAIINRTGVRGVSVATGPA